MSQFRGWIGAGVLAACAAGCGPQDLDLGVSHAPRDSSSGQLAQNACTGEVGSWKVVGTWQDVTHDLIYAQGKVFAVDNVGKRVAVIDTETDTVTNQVTPGKRPWHLATDGKRVAVLNSWAESPPDELVTVFDAKSLRKVGSVPVPFVDGEYANYPSDLGFFNDTLYVTNFTFKNPKLHQVSTSNWRVRNNWVGGSGPDAVAGAGSYLFVANFRNMGAPDDAIRVTNPQTGDLIWTLETNSNIKDMVTGPDDRVYVAVDGNGPGQGKLLMVDPTLLEAKELPVGDFPYQVAVQGDNVYVVAKDSRSITVFNTVTAEECTIDLNQLSPIPNNPMGLAVAPCGKIYVEADNMVAVRVSNEAIQARISMLTEHLAKLAATPSTPSWRTPWCSGCRRRRTRCSACRPGRASS